MGASVARELSRYKLNVAILEKEEELAFGVSKSNSGIIHPGTQNSPNSLKGKLCVQGNFLMRRLARELGVDFKEAGELIVAFSEQETLQLLQLKKDAERLAIPGIRMVNRNWLEKNEPNLNRKVNAALYAPTAGIISPYRLVYDLSENARKNGVEIHTQAKVEGISRLSENNPRFKIATSCGEFNARYVINCAGLYADEVAKMVGVNDFKISPRKGEEFLLDKKRKGITRHLIFPVPSKNTKGVLIIRSADGNPMIGPTAEDIEDKQDLSTSDAGLQKVVSAAQKLVPSIDPHDIIAYFAGLRPTAGDDFIIRAEKSVPGFVTVAGIQSPGLTAAPAIALMVLDILKKNGLILKKKLIFHHHRKRSVHLFEIPLGKTKRLIKKYSGYGDIVCRCEMVSAKEIEDAIARGARTLDGIKFRTRAQAGRCHGSFCAARLMKILSEKTNTPVTQVTKRGVGSEIVKSGRGLDG